MSSFDKALDKILLEFDLVPINTSSIGNRKARVYTDPTPALVKKLMKEWGELGGFLVKGKQLLVWNRDDIEHEDVASHFGIQQGMGKSPKNPIPFYVFGGKTIQLSPFSWFGVDAEKDALRVQASNAAFQKLAIDVKYFQR